MKQIQPKDLSLGFLLPIRGGSRHLFVRLFRLHSAKTQRKLKLSIPFYDKLKAGFRFERSPPDDVGHRVIENGVCIRDVKGFGFGFKGRRPPNPEWLKIFVMFIGGNGMGSIVREHLTGLKFGEMQTFKNMAILPIFMSINDGPDYLTLKEALDAKHLIITEVDQSGSVPMLKVINTANRLILLLDGEELIGAKQNRVLNTSILLAQNSKTLIPVSCTEQGRWAYTSAAFDYSEAFMSHKARSGKLRAVTLSLHEGRGYSSDQGQVWAEIEKLHLAAGTSSRTRAMRDVYTAKTKDLEAYLQTFTYAPQQRGLLVFINGEVVGFDIVSREMAYKTVHPQFVKSYAMDALLQSTEQPAEPSVKEATNFLQKAMKCNESRFEAVGQGYDYRFEGPKVIGSALVHSERVIHMAFFKADENDAQDGHMPSLLQRRHYRRIRNS